METRETMQTKETYEELEMEVIEFDTEDVITTSSTPIIRP